MPYRASWHFYFSSPEGMGRATPQGSRLLTRQTYKCAPASRCHPRRLRGGALQASEGSEITVRQLPSTLSTAYLALIVTLGVLLPRTAVASPTFVQGAAASTGSRVPSLTVTLTHPVAQGDLLVGWFAQYNAPGPVLVS